MAASKKEGKRNDTIETKPDSIWRKPIALNAFEDEDPLATLYRGREVGQSTVANEKVLTNSNISVGETDQKKSINAKSAAEMNKSSDRLTKKQTGSVKVAFDELSEEAQTSISNKVTESELKAILKIKGDFFRFTDLREILRGKSFDIYSYLRVLSGEQGFCKIRHLDLMSRLDVSRPTLFKQQEWLTRLSLIEKRTVPGDHLGTFYTVHRLEDVLPLPGSLVAQLEANIESLRQTVV